MRSPIKEQDNAGQWRPWAEHGGRRFRVGRSGKSLFLLPCYNTTAHCQTDESEGVHHVNRLFFMGKPKLVFFLRFWSRKKTCADWPKWRAHVADLLRIWVNVVNCGNVWLWLNCSLLGLWKLFRSNFESNFCEIDEKGENVFRKSFWSSGSITSRFKCGPIEAFPDWNTFLFPKKKNGGNENNLARRDLEFCSIGQLVKLRSFNQNVFLFFQMIWRWKRNEFVDDVGWPWN